MRTAIHLNLTRHDHPVIEKDDEDLEPDEEPYVVVKLSETISLSGASEDIFNWIDELHARSQLIR